MHACIQAGVAVKYGDRSARNPTPECEHERDVLLGWHRQDFSTEGGFGGEARGKGARGVVGHKQWVLLAADTTAATPSARASAMVSLNIA